MIGLAALAGIFATVPTSTNYTLKNYDIGSGGGSGSSSSYKLNGISGTENGAQVGSSNYKLNAGEPNAQTASVPPAPTFTNPSNQYNRLRLALSVGTDPTDTKYLIAISPDSFTTTYYVQTDDTISSSLSFSNYQTNTAWGASGFWVVGLVPGTTYSVKVKALQGNFTGSAYGPTATAATVQPSITFSVETSLTSTPPFNVNFSSLPAGSVVSANATAIMTLSSNALMGGSIYVSSSNAGLRSTAASYTLNSATANLTAAANGYGGIVTSASQSSGGPLAAISPFNGAGNNVGVLSTALQTVASTPAPITTGSLTVSLKAKADNVIPSATDYADSLTFLAAMTF
jgi:hypothetical protein